jgi:lactobin A/cerein 7B family class IIb bacteriocin
MEVLKSNELRDINGGAIKFGIILTFISAIISIVGVIDGLLRPLKCNAKK